MVCPSCNANVPVPKLRELSRLEEHRPEQRSGADGWSLPHSLALAGAAVAILSIMGMTMVNSRRLPQGVTPEALRAAVLAARDDEILDAWRKLSQAGVERPPTVEERRLQRWAIFSRGVSRGLMVLGGLGGALAAAGGGMLYAAAAADGTAATGAAGDGSRGNGPSGGRTR
ncbi:MAG: hypothetical protein EBZ59_10780 [Planctomycetia bacterium]|nr:hypothetical protein [Planctomycetia bacterium]